MPPRTIKQSKIEARRENKRRAFLFVYSSDQLDQFYGDFGKRVRELRRQQNLTQTELAERAKISRSYLAQIESGQRRVSLHIAYNIAASQHLSIDELLYR